MRGVFRPAQAGLDEHKSGLHEHDQEAGDQRPHQVDREQVVGDAVVKVGGRELALGCRLCRLRLASPTRRRRRPSDRANVVFGSGLVAVKYGGNFGAGAAGAAAAGAGASAGLVSVPEAGAGASSAKTGRIISIQVTTTARHKNNLIVIVLPILASSFLSSYYLLNRPKAALPHGELSWT